METELDLLLGTVIDNLPKLEALLYLHSHPGGAQSADDIAAALHRPVPQVKSALEDLSRSELIERFSFGSGKHAVYGTTEDPHVRALLGLLHDRCHRDPEARSRLVRQVLQPRQSPEPQTTSGPTSSSDCSNSTHSSTSP
jgi:hypothetical protein